MTFTFGSVCSGIEAASVAWKPLGWDCAFMSEIEAFPRAVLQHHYPEVPLHGDFTTIRAGEYRPIQLLVGGTPCQSFSVAGLRGGLDDDRGNLALEYLSLADRLRPRWLVWENVPGVLSSNGGRDFGAILGGMVELGYGFAYRVLDAQFFGVAQRRRRVFVVGYAGDWRRAAAVLFERHSLQGHPAPRREAREGSAGGVAHSLRAGGFDASEDGTGRGTPLVPVHAFDARQSDVIQYGDMTGPLDTDGHTMGVLAFSAQDDGGDAARDLSPTLRSGATYGANGGVMPAIAFALRGREGGAMPEIGGDQACALRAASGGSSRDYVAFSLTPESGVDGGVQAIEAPVANTITGVSEAGKNGRGLHLLQQSGVRRLTPRECERLQGFPEVENTLRILVCRNEDEKRARARSAKSSSALLVPEQSEPVAVHVLIDLERQVLQLHSLGRSPSSASIAEAASLSRHPLPADAFARLAALTNAIVERAIRTGETAPRQSTTSSSPAASGSVLAPLCGSEIDGLASDAERFTAALSRCSKFITSEAGPDTPSFASILETSACCAAAAMTGFIPEAMRNACSYELRLTVHQGYTHIPWRKGMAPDGPRYKALGNSMAVPVMRWIGERIQSVEALAQQSEAA